ncbi:MAG: four helix bundle protein [Bacteroidales bacterium]|nr:four helix bundle protein [Bacteroidales bacterium]
MKENTIKDESYKFAIRIVRMYKTIIERDKEYVLSKQCLRSGTSIGALVSEAEHAQSTADFIHKMNIALKEANETVYWLNLLKDTGFLSEKEHNSIHTDAIELVKILASIVKTMKEKGNNL